MSTKRHDFLYHQNRRAPAQAYWLPNLLAATGRFPVARGHQTVRVFPYRRASSDAYFIFNGPVGFTAGPVVVSKVVRRGYYRTSGA